MHSQLPVTPRVNVIRVSNGPMTNYNYLVSDSLTRVSVIVDPAWELKKIQDQIASSNTRLAAVLLTHSHSDHIDLAGVVSDEYRCPIYMSTHEQRYSGFTHDRLHLIDEQSWNESGLTVHAIATPGHTPGCICYRIGANVFTGDVLFAEGCGLVPDHDSAHTMFHSLAKLKRILNPATRVYPGHSFGQPPGQYFSDVMKNNIYLHFKDAQQFTDFRMRKGQNLARLFDFQ